MPHDPNASGKDATKTDGVDLLEKERDDLLGKLDISEDLQEQILSLPLKPQVMLLKEAQDSPGRLRKRVTQVRMALQSRPTEGMNPEGQDQLFRALLRRVQEGAVQPTARDATAIGG